MSLPESGEQRYIKAISNNNNILLVATSSITDTNTTVAIGEPYIFLVTTSYVDITIVAIGQPYIFLVTTSYVDITIVAIGQPYILFTTSYITVNTVTIGHHTFSWLLLVVLIVLLLLLVSHTFWLLPVILLLLLVSHTFWLLPVNSTTVTVGQPYIDLQPVGQFVTITAQHSWFGDRQCKAVEGHTWIFLIRLGWNHTET